VDFVKAIAPSIFVDDSQASVAVIQKVILKVRDEPRLRKDLQFVLKRTVPTLDFEGDLDVLLKLLVANCIQGAINSGIELSKIIDAAKATGFAFDFRQELCKLTELSVIQDLLTKLGDDNVASYVYAHIRDQLWGKLSDIISSFSADSPMTGI
jgi:hypothetical protein